MLNETFRQTKYCYCAENLHYIFVCYSKHVRQKVVMVVNKVLLLLLSVNN